MLVLLSGTILSVLAAVSISWLFPRPAPVDWLCREYKLDLAASDEVKKLHAEYEQKCFAMCHELVARDNELARQMRLGRPDPLELEAAVSASCDARAKCRLMMAEHFQAVAAQLPVTERQRYLQMVAPAVAHLDLASPEQ